MSQETTSFSPSQTQLWPRPFLSRQGKVKEIGNLGCPDLTPPMLHLF